MSQLPFSIGLNMTGNGKRSITIPEGYAFLTIINYTDNKIQVYGGSDVGDPFATFPLFTALTLPIPRHREFIFQWTNGGATEEKIAHVLFTQESLGINGVLGTQATNGSFTVTADSVGLAKETQLPSNLDPTGYLAVVVKNAQSLEPGDNNIGNVDVLSLPSLPTGTNTIGKIDMGNIAQIGTHAGAWNNVAVAAGGTSTSLNVGNHTVVSFFGQVSAATDLVVQFSQDNANWYDSEEKRTLAGAGNFGFTLSCGARYVRLKSSAAATITATIAGKM